MTFTIERARSRKPVTWLTLLGILLLPAVIGGILVAALSHPTERLDAMTGAIVNLDEPVTIDGQYTPLGRVLGAGLVEGSDDIDSNLTWLISNEDDAAAGLADGTYQAVITIPANFSAAATSAGQALGGASDVTPERAVIEVTTPPDGRIADDLVMNQIATVASTTIGTMLTETTLENVLIGFGTLGDQLGDAADGAATWADGAGSAADGALTLADGIRALAGGAGQLAAGADAVANGADGIASGASALALGAHDAADGLHTWAGGARELSAGTAELATGLGLMADQVGQLPTVPQELVDGAHAIAGRSAEIQAAVSDAAARLEQIAATCAAEGGSAQLCALIAEVSQQADSALPTVNEVIGQSGQLATGIEQLAQFGPQLTAALQQSATGASQLAGGMSALADGAVEAAEGVSGLAGGMSQLSVGAADLAAGTHQLAGGATELSSGAAQAADGTDDLADGVAALAEGAETLAGGLAQASDALPSFDDSEAATLASVVADPVGADAANTSLFGATAVPLLAVLVLWFGALASFIPLRAVTDRVLTSRRASGTLVLRSFAPAAALGAGQGLLVAAVVQVVTGYAFMDWIGFAGVAMLAGVAFAAVNQALVAILGGAGRWVGAVVGVVLVATGIISTVPAWLASIAAALPTAPALAGLIAPSGAAVAGLVVWGVLALGAMTVAVMVRRTTSAKAVSAAA